METDHQMNEKFLLYCDVEETRRVDCGSGPWSYSLLGPENGCVNECMTGVSGYSSTDFTPPDVHTFQEGFMVLSGSGEAKVGEDVFALKPMRSFLVPAGMEHALRSSSLSEPLMVFWFHAKG